ncbi:MAG: hypothetical protein FWF63_07040 [Fibromonadales bacterium]|nr:hypothetical protein [Fibromonadales bacterium]
MKLKFAFLAVGLVLTISCSNRDKDEVLNEVISSSSEEDSSSSVISSSSEVKISSSSISSSSEARISSSSISSSSELKISSSSISSSSEVKISSSSRSSSSEVKISSSQQQSSGSDSDSRIDEIRAKWQQYKPKNVPTVFIETPSVTNPYKTGSLTTEFLTNGLNMFKFVRYLAGLSENIVYTDELNDIAQHGAVLLASLGQLTHTPSKPADMDSAFYERGYKSTTSANLYMSGSKTSTLDDAVKTFCDDSGESNIGALGHRRWMLHPPLGKVGFGYATSPNAAYIPLQIFDKSNTTEKLDAEYVLWPNKGYFPSNFFRTAQAWSVSLNSKNYNLNKCKPTVKLTSLDDGKEWVFSTSDNDKKGKYFNVETSGYGTPYCIIFRPDGLSSFNTNKRFKVEIEGLMDKSDKAQKIEYEVEFFAL